MRRITEDSCEFGADHRFAQRYGRGSEETTKTFEVGEIHQHAKKSRNIEKSSRRKRRWTRRSGLKN